MDPFILTKFIQAKTEGDEDPIVSLVIFEWKDEDLVGVWPSEDAPKVQVHTLHSQGNLANSVHVQKAFICDDASVESKFCEATQIGQFILNSNASEASKNPVVTQSIHLKDPQPVNYPVKRTGYYCVGTFGYSAEDYKAVVEFRNAYGELQAAQIAKLPFYGGLTIVYAVMSM